jgi:hypothetical protein
MRRNPTKAQRERLLAKNGGMCCVCKAFRVGLEFHKPFSSTGAYSHQRCMVGSGRRFVDDSALEQSGFEPLVPLTLDGTKATEKG